MTKLSLLQGLVFATLVLTFSCKTYDQSLTAYEGGEETTTVEEADTTIDIAVLLQQLFGVSNEDKTYQPAENKNFDLLHTRLNVSFDFEQQRLNGEAWLKVKPYFYPAAFTAVDAKGFDIHSLKLSDAGRSFEPRYTYDNELILIFFDTLYTRQDTLEIYISYTAKPTELPEGGSFAITSDRGLCFIDPLETDNNKPTQIWTQGETESSSCWFPTYDRPNERTTQDISIRVDNKFTTLSNGVLIDVVDHSDGTRTDRWVMDQPHAPYLFMMAVGEFEITHDTWRDIPVTYYLEPEFHPYAKSIFGNTPEMLTFFSDILGVDYPWQKYAQVVVQDFVSGAMENTTATVFYDGLHKTTSELIDNSEDEIIAHELFHHWFGDLVTCESWANLPLNESFATYGEYLWYEYKYGRDEADYHGQHDLLYYLIEAIYKQEPLIRHHYHLPDDMFDTHSYQKGGRVLHMLRKYLGDEAFFTGLKLYLEENAYQSVEIHDLRLAFEQVTGEDLNWFFDQWFFRPGHPKLTIDYDYDPSLDETYVTIRQETSIADAPLYRLPVDVDVYYSDNVERYREVISGAETELVYPGAPKLINVDAEWALLCEKNDNKDFGSLLYQFKNAPLMKDREEALDAAINREMPEVMISEIIRDALADPHWSIRQKGIYEIDLESDELVANMAIHDPHAQVRYTAIDWLESNGSGRLVNILDKAMADPAALVRNKALLAMNGISPERALPFAEQLAATGDIAFTESVAAVFAGFGLAKHADFFEHQIKHYPRSKDYLIESLGAYIEKCEDQTIVIAAIQSIGNLAKQAENNNEGSEAREMLDELHMFYSDQPGHISASVAETITKMLDDIIRDIDYGN